MRKLLIALFLLAVLTAGYHLGSMGALMMPAGVHMDAASGMGPDCPMGFICPMRFGSIDFTAAQPSFTKLLTVAAAITAGIICVAFNGYQTGYTPPFSVAYNSGPPVIRTKIKRE